MHISYLSLSFTRTFRPRHRSGLHRGETSPLRRGSFPPATMPSADFCRAMVAPYGLISPYGQRGRPPGVNTCPSVRQCRVYGHTLRWIEDFVLMCRLVPVCAPHTRFLYVIPYLRGTLPQQGGFLPMHRHRYPVAIPLHPSPPSGWVKDLPNTSKVYISGSLIRTCAVPGTHNGIKGDGKTLPRLMPSVEAVEKVHNFSLSSKYT